VEETYEGSQQEQETREQVSSLESYDDEYRDNLLKYEKELEEIAVKECQQLWQPFYDNIEALVLKKQARERSEHNSKI